ncbi:MAG: DinB family protein [Candidatus Eisenbacteria bacterium]|uniref:DinB family protein n=1 Tax=Eiseniibacteriota bacterium TaxID=2212470 RepID=A0A956RMQ4_UNCEI|nr:DinB family protein [Candidatus Eisenbacteria bacterium]
MYCRNALLDIHVRAHQSLAGLLRHCRELTADELRRELPGFGYPTVHEQLEHVIGAEQYWMRVVRGTYVSRQESDEGDGRFPTVEALEQFRVVVAGETEDDLRNSTDEAWNEPREMLTWPDNRRILVPALILLRTQMHIYQHQGQVMAMCRTMGKPGPAGLDFPIV